jgi:hypothetical protein
MDRTADSEKLDILREELNKTKAGQKVVKALRECYTEQKATLKPLRDEVRRDHITAAAKMGKAHNLQAAVPSVFPQCGGPQASGFQLGNASSIITLMICLMSR